MPRKGENIYKRKDGRWEGRFIKNHDLQGKAHYGYVYGKTYTEAKQLLREKQRLVSPNIGECNKGAALYSTVLLSWMESQRIHIKESTYARYYQVVYTHLLPKIGSIRVDKITTKVIEKYVAELISSGRIDGKGGRQLHGGTCL